MRAVPFLGNRSVEAVLFTALFPFFLPVLVRWIFVVLPYIFVEFMQIRTVKCYVR